MKIAALVLVTLFVLFWSLNGVAAGVNDKCWRPDGLVSERAGIALMLLLLAVSNASMVVLWSYL